jgi:perosamine synthetase
MVRMPHVPPPQAPHETGAATACAPLPRAPVLDWSSFAAHPAAASPSVEQLPSLVCTTSGRAAIYQALQQLGLAPGSRVLVPTYHCPTMIAPVLLAGLRPAYFALRSDGLPDLDALERRVFGPDDSRATDAERDAPVGAIIVAHYFGLPRSLAAVREWCDGRGIALLEDCAHCHFGQAGERPVGAWGDYATSSLSKFLPVPEAGLLGSAHRPIVPFQLQRPSALQQLKGFIDVLEFAARHGRLAGLRPLLATVFALKNQRIKRRLQAGHEAPHQQPASTAAEMLRDCDMDRIDRAPLWVSTRLKRLLPRAPIVARRRENYTLYGIAFGDAAGARPLFAVLPDAAAPYVFPLWVDDAERVYRTLLAQQLPVFRWDRIWPGTPQLAGDAGPQWSRHVLQLLCHQDLSAADIGRTVAATLAALRPDASATPRPAHDARPGPRGSAALATMRHGPR